MRLLLVVSLLAAAPGPAERKLTKEESSFFSKADALKKALPKAPAGWVAETDEVVAPGMMLTEQEPGFKSGELRLSAALHGEYRDEKPRDAEMVKASEAGKLTAEEEKKLSALEKKLEAATKKMTAAGPKANEVAKEVAALTQELAQTRSGPLERSNAAMVKALYDSQARIVIEVNPTELNTVGCGFQKSAKERTVAGVTKAIEGDCATESAPGEAPRGLLLLFGAWDVAIDGPSLTAKPKFDAKKPHHVAQAVAVSLSGTPERVEALLAKLDVKPFAALIAK